MKRASKERTTPISRRIGFLLKGPLPDCAGIGPTVASLFHLPTSSPAIFIPPALTAEKPLQIPALLRRQAIDRKQVFIDALSKRHQIADEMNSDGMGILRRRKILPVNLADRSSKRKNVPANWPFRDYSPYSPVNRTFRREISGISAESG